MYPRTMYNLYILKIKNKGDYKNDTKNFLYQTKYKIHIEMQIFKSS